MIRRSGYRTNFLCFALVVLLRQVEDLTPLPTRASSEMKGNKQEHPVQMRGIWRLGLGVLTRGQGWEEPPGQVRLFHLHDTSSPRSL